MSTLEQVKAAVLAGKTVHWATKAYRVERDTKAERWDVVCTLNDSRVGLYWLDGIKSDYKPTDFFEAIP